MLCHEGSHYLQWSYVAGAKEGDRQEVLACLASQLQTSVIPQLNTCVCVYLCACLCVCSWLCSCHRQEMCYNESELAGLFIKTC